tara:strand:- start:145 stop:465 length:321 start_codon:yes stop_codon:yes gene_type:complete
MIKVKRKRRSKKNKEFLQTLLFFFTSILSIVGLIAYLWVYTEVDENMLSIEIQMQVEKQLKNTVKELKMDIAQLSSSGRISNFARNELKMIPANPETLTIYINQFD